MTSRIPSKAPATHTIRKVRFGTLSSDPTSKMEKLEKKGWSLLKVEGNSDKALEKFQKAMKIADQYAVKTDKALLLFGMARSLQQSNLFLACKKLEDAIESNPPQKLHKKLVLTLIRFRNQNKEFQKALENIEGIFSSNKSMVIDLAFRSKLIHEGAKATHGLNKLTQNLHFPQEKPIAGVSITTPIEAYKHLKNYYLFLKAVDKPKDKALYVDRCLKIFNEALVLGYSKSDLKELESLVEKAKNRFPLKK